MVLTGECQGHVLPIQLRIEHYLFQLYSWTFLLSNQLGVQCIILIG